MTTEISLPHGSHDEPPDLDNREVKADGPAPLLLGASRIGRGHQREEDGKRQDAFGMASGGDSKGGWFAIAVADGLGSCEHSHVGSNTVVSSALDFLSSWPSSRIRRHPETLVSLAASRGLDELHDAADDRDIPQEDLSTTLLLLLGLDHPEGFRVATFQAGDGYMCAGTWDGEYHKLSEDDDEDFATQVTPLNRTRFEEEWEQHKHLFHFESQPDLFLVMSDGVGIDLLPRDRCIPLLLGELGGFVQGENRTERLLDYLNYEKKGSTDDRTLALAMLHAPSKERGTEPADLSDETSVIFQKTTDGEPEPDDAPKPDPGRDTIPVRELSGETGEKS